ncbi:MAG TPA: ABC transporter permease [Pyrinomonadaceae bacterium]|nr:ABC transporter permease [Pyrinomonadaceae bacterium]
MTKDIRYAIRSLLKQPAFTAIAIITLALGIGANTTIFSVVNAVLLRSLPYPHGDRLVSLYQNSREQREMSVSFPDYVEWKEQQSTFADMGAMMPAGGIMTGDGGPQRVIGRLVSASFFSTLEVQPALGRSFSPSEDQPGGNRVMVLSHELWRQRYGGDPNVINRTITYNAEPWTVIGVMPAGFDFYGINNANNEFFMPLGHLTTEEFMHDRRSHTVRVIGRLQAGVALDQARALMTAMAGRQAAQYPDSNTDVGAGMKSMLDDYIGDQRRPLLVVFAAVAFMLLIACANVANLMLARATARKREIALRLALGASRWRVARQLLTESLLLALSGGILGVLIATWGVSVLIRLGEDSLSRTENVNVDLQALGFTFLITLFVALLFGLAPALQGTRTQLSEALKEGGRSSSSGASGRLRSSLVLTEVALALMLLIGAGLTLKSFGRLLSVDPGYDARNVLTLRLRLPDGKYRDSTQTSAFSQAAIARVSALPGVERVAMSTGFPLGRAMDGSYQIEGQPEPLAGQDLAAIRQDVSDQYHAVLNIPLRSGRLFTTNDTEKSPLVVLIDEQLVARSFPGISYQDVVGKRLKLNGDTDGWRQIVGIVKHVKQNGFDEEGRPQIYRPLEQITPKWKANLMRANDMLVKTSVDSTSLIGAIRKEILAIDKDQPIAQVATLESKVDLSVATQRFTLLLLSVFSVIALSLASAGIYGVMSYSVSQRTQELGIRMALGANAIDVLKLVLGGGLKLALAGIAIGLLGAFALTRLMTSLLFGVAPTDVVTFSLVSLVLLVVALLACYLPARRATKVDPLVALKYE